MKQLIVSCCLVFLVPAYTSAHGVSNTTATINLRPHGMVELNVQFHFIDLMHHMHKGINLASVAAMTPEKFKPLYQSVVELFDRQLILTQNKNRLVLHARYPDIGQVLGLLKREFLEKSHGIDKNAPYTFGDRRFYQVFTFDVTLPNKNNIKSVKVSLPKTLGEVNLTINQSLTCHLNQVTAWTVFPRSRTGCASL